VQDWLVQSARSASLQAAQASAQTASGGRAAPTPEIEIKNGTQRLETKGSQLPKKKLSYKEQRELDGLPAQLRALETEQAGIDAALADGRLFSSDPARAAVLSQRHAAIDDELLTLMERQEALTG
jgi:ABC transport system ATP-binding/permease protein